MVRRSRKDICLGGFPNVSLADAREDAAKLRSRARKGEDILEARRAEKRVIPTFKEAALIYHEKISETFGSEAMITTPRFRLPGSSDNSRLIVIVTVRVLGTIDSEVTNRNIHPGTKAQKNRGSSVPFVLFVANSRCGGGCRLAPAHRSPSTQC